jgi:hypothetical protein
MGVICRPLTARKDGLGGLQGEGPCKSRLSWSTCSDAPPILSRMPRRRALRDFIYVSESKVSRLFDAIPRSRFGRISSVNAQVLGSGGGFTREPAPAESAIAKLPPVEAHIRKDFGVMALSDDRLSSGDWLECRGVMALYGCPVVNLGAVVFIARHRHMSVLLVGSARSMRDGSPPVHVETRLSDFGAPYRVLHHAAREDAPAIAPSQEWITVGEPDHLPPRRDVEYVASNMVEALLPAVPERKVSFVAQVTDVLPPDYKGTTWVLGTPLYVEASQRLLFR